jgi:3-oxoacyl-(acyl-carrier-protein) synthase
MTDTTRSVVVTGVGLATPLGVGREALLEGLATGQSVLAPLDGLFGKVAPGRGALLDLPRKRFKEWINTRILRLSTMTRQTTLGCIAASDAAASAGLPVDMETRNPEDLEKHLDRGCFLGSFIVPPPFTKQIKAARILARRPPGQDSGWVLDDTRLGEAMKMASGFDFLRALPNMPSSHLSIQLAYQGPACTMLGSDTSGMQAIVQAVGTIRSGQANVMVAGGAFCPFQEVHLAWQHHRGLYADARGVDLTPRPFGVGASGTLPGEAAAVIVLESREHAEARGATILAEITGTAQRVLAPGEPDEIDVRAETLRLAAPDGAIWLGPTALGQLELDRLEAAAYDAAFGDLSGSAAVAVAPTLGFSGPAHGPTQLIAALLAASGELAPARTTVDAAPGCASLAGALGRTAATGPGTTAVASSFSLDGILAAVGVRIHA